MQCHLRLTRTIIRAAIAVSVLAFLPPAMAAVYPPQQVLPAQAIQQFLADPGALLTQYPNGGPDMIKAVQDLAASDPSTLNALLGLLAKANSDQAKAIGTALGKVAKAAAGGDPGYATQIQVGVALANNDSALGAFNVEVGGDIQLTAVTGGAGGGGGGGQVNPLGNSGGTGGGGNSFNLTTGIITIPDAFSSPNFSPGTPGTITITTITSSQSSASP